MIPLQFVLITAVIRKAFCNNQITIEAETIGIENEVFVLAREDIELELQVEETRQFSKLEPISKQSLLSYMEKITVSVEKSIKAELPSKFGIVIDGWSVMATSTHYLAIFGCYSVTIFELQNFLDLADRDTADLLPGPSENFKLRECLQHLQKFESVSKKLQKTTCTKKESRILFDALLSEFPELSQHLGTQGVIECPTFERAVYKFQMKETLTSLEKEVLQKALLDVEITTVESSTSSQDYAEKILAKKLRSSDDSVIQCLDWLPVTSNIAERLFSQTKHVFSQYRKRLLPRHLEMQLFLMVNDSFWSVETVSKIS